MSLLPTVLSKLKAVSDLIEITVASNLLSCGYKLYINELVIS